MALTSEEVCATQVSKPAIPTGQEIIEAASISEAEGDTNNSIKVFHCPRKVSLYPSFELETQLFYS